MRSIELRCAIAHLRISRFRVRLFEAPRNDATRAAVTQFTNSATALGVIGGSEEAAGRRYHHFNLDREDRRRGWKAALPYTSRTRPRSPDRSSLVRAAMCRCRG